MLKRWLIRLFGLLLFTLLVLLTLRFCAPHIENDLHNTASQALQAKQLDWAQVQANGRTLILTGKAPTIERQKQAEQVIRNIWGTIHIDNQLRVAEPLQPYLLKANYDGQRLTLEGYTVDTRSRNLINQTIQQHFDNASTLITWSEREGQPANWAMAASSLITQLHTLQYGQLILENKMATLTGKAISIEAIKTIDENLSSYRAQDYQVHFNLSAPPPEPTCQEKFDRLLSAEKIKFGNNLASIDASSYPLLTRLKTIAKECSKFGIQVAGHTDSVGNDAANQVLSQGRADAVVAHLVKQGLDPSRLTAMGYGETQPIADNGNQVGRAINRRIELTIMGN